MKQPAFAQTGQKKFDFGKFLALAFLAVLTQNAFGGTVVSTHRFAPMRTKSLLLILLNFISNQTPAAHQALVPCTN